MIINKMPPDRKVDMTKVIVQAQAFTYSGNTQSIVLLYRDQILTRDVDYTVSGQDSGVNAGSYSATITGINGYKGTKVVDWVINPAELPVSVWRVRPTAIARNPNYTSVEITVELTSAVDENISVKNVIMRNIRMAGSSTSTSGSMTASWKASLGADNYDFTPNLTIIVGTSNYSSSYTQYFTTY